MPRHLLRLVTILALPLSAPAAQINVPFEKYSLPNGLTVVLAENHTTPLAAVAVAYHVGSKNEIAGRTGFAHMFEHVMFTGSGHAPYGLQDKYTEGVGGGNNGETSSDWTRYYESIPANYLETILWLESDRMGFLLDSLDEAKFRAQRDVVKNERRQYTDNAPYARDNEIVGMTMFPRSHPYSWPVIGSMTDLGNATVDDVKRFFRLYYAPNNATLLISGDFNATQVKGWIAKYFGEFVRGAPITRPTVGPTTLTGEKRITFEDDVQVPRLTITWPSVDIRSDDQPALDLLSDILGNTRAARINKTLIYDNQLATAVSVYQNASENIGQFQISVTPRSGHTLTEIETQVDKLVAQIKRDGPTADELKRVKAGQQRSLVSSLETNLGKVLQMGQDEIFFGNPAYSFTTGYARAQSVTAADVKRVANKYLGATRLVLSNVPLGKRSMASHAAKSIVVTDPFTEKSAEVKP